LLLLVQNLLAFACCIKIYFVLSSERNQMQGKRNNSVAFTPQANSTDWSSAAAGELMPAFAGREFCLDRAANPFGG
jgi:hypothetical protein